MQGKNSRRAQRLFGACRLADAAEIILRGVERDKARGAGGLMTQHSSLAPSV